MFVYLVNPENYLTLLLYSLCTLRKYIHSGNLVRKIYMAAPVLGVNL